MEPCSPPPVWAPHSKGSPQGDVLFLPQDARLLGGVQPKPLVQRASRKTSEGGWGAAGSRLCAHPWPLYLCQGESFNGHLGKALGGGQPSIARSPALQTRPDCSPPPQLSDPAQAPEPQPRPCPYPTLGEMLFIWACYELPAEVSPVTLSAGRRGKSP